ncbi:hypothetical protein PHMEG_00015446 [Phytophthora megakarya]|uniref:Uncharacterized protein n=1 Tax=Phytophthora megakarya TaxID=4795 RepID=A0A225W2T7_9STRA|nr:hypothetical protein PHMEG_00015446 [Phytophthora megakarya]
MNLAQLDPLARIAWVMSSTVNMQDFSSTVPLPEAPSAHNVDNILGALAGLRTYCVAFCAADAINLAEAMSNHGNSLWSSDDFKYLVYWLNKLLEDYRTCAHDDILSGEATRVQNKLVSSNPDLQLANQLITSRKGEQLMASSNAPVYV